MILVDDPADPRLDPFRDLLTRRRARTPSSSRASSPSPACSPARTSHPRRPRHRPPPARLPPATCPVYVGDRALFRAVLGFDLHRGVIACAERPAALRRDLPQTTCPIGPVLGASSLADLLAAPRGPSCWSRASPTRQPRLDHPQRPRLRRRPRDPRPPRRRPPRAPGDPRRHGPRVRPAARPRRRPPRRRQQLRKSRAPPSGPRPSGRAPARWAPPLARTASSCGRQRGRRSAARALRRRRPRGDDPDRARGRLARRRGGHRRAAARR
jgi:hypothetical protein